MIERGGVTIPKLDFSVIYLQRDQASEANEEGTDHPEGQEAEGANQQNQGSFFKQNKSA